MKILQLTHKMPFPLNDGGSLAIHFYIEGFLNAGISLSVLAMNTTRHYVNEEQVPELYKNLDFFKAVKVDTDIKMIDAFKNLFRKSSYNIDRFISEDYERELIQLLKNEKFDIIQLESLFVTPYIETIRKYSSAKIVIRQHNVEFKIWERLAASEKKYVKKKYLSFLAKRLKAHELKYLNQYDLLLPISQTDAEILKGLGLKKPVLVHPFGIETTKLEKKEINDLKDLKLYHIGAMDWLPNIESVNFFLEKVMPKIHALYPEIKFFLAGRKMPPFYFENKWPGVEVVGEVANAHEFEEDKHILMVPLLSGGGVRIKIFQAMAKGKVVITTNVGVEGIEVENRKHVFIANNPDEFVEALDYLLKNPDLILKIGDAARNLIKEKYDQVKLIDELINRYKLLISTTY